MKCDAMYISKIPDHILPIIMTYTTHLLRSIREYQTEIKKEGAKKTYLDIIRNLYYTYVSENQQVFRL